MATTYKLISQTVLSSTSSLITLNSIPSTFTDLELRAAVRYTNASNSYPLSMRVNGLTTSIYSYRRYYGQGTAGIANSGSSASDELNLGEVNGNSSTGSTFSNIKLYIPNYAASGVNKVMSYQGAQEDNVASYAFLTVQASLIGTTSAITSLSFKAPAAYGALTFAVGTTFSLYGISNT